MNMIDEATRPIEPDLFLSSNQHPQQAVKSKKMVDMRMRDKDVFEALDFTRRQTRYVAEIEHDRAFFKERLDIECRIAEAPIDQSRV